MKTRRDLIKGLFSSSGKEEKAGGIEPSAVRDDSQSPFFEFSGEMLYFEAMKNGIDPSCYSEKELVKILTQKMQSDATA